jgi:UDP-glucose 4-epimerase
MRVLVTGGAGFIGANLVEYLSASGSYEVVVLDDLSAGQPRPIFPRGVRFVCGDFTDKRTTTECLHGVDVVVHLAALPGVVASIEDPRPSFAVNVAGSFQLLELARAANVRRFINASTGGALLGEVTPPISEQMAPSPLSPYGASKLAVEGYCSAFAGAYGLACATLRFSNIYGPRSAHKTSVVAAFIKNIIRDEPLVVYGDGSQQRDYLYVDDLARGIEAGLRRELTGVYQLGRGEGTTLHTLIATLKKVSGRDFQVRYEPRRSGEVRATWCDIAKATREFGYRAPTELEAGLRQTWTWFVENREIWSRQLALSASD